MPNTTYEIELSFFPLVNSEFQFLVYRRPLADWEQPVAGIRTLPEKEYAASESRVDRKSKRRFEISYLAKDGFDPYHCYSWVEANLTLDILFSVLKARCDQQDLKDHVIFPQKAFLRHIAFVLARHDEGDEVVWLRPYALRTTGEFGFLTDFAFYAKENGQPGKRTLELSLSQKAGRPNRDFYADRYEKLRSFVRTFGERLQRLPLQDGSQVEIRFSPRRLQASTLNERVYVLRDEVEVESPFQGLRQNEPLKPAAPNARLVFLFREDDRLRSQELFRALRGDLFATFPGMTPLFRCRFDKLNTSGLPVAGFTHSDLLGVATDLKSRFGAEPVIVIAIVPFSKHKSPEDTASYFAAKHALLQEGLASQFVDKARFENRDSLKWAISNIGLAVFAKMGGYPWKVKPTTTRGLIIGIGQAHRMVNDEIRRYFAYCVLTDSSGLYERVCVLASSPSQDEYLKSLKVNLKDILISHKDQFDSFVVHATFRIRRSELEAIKALLSEITAGEGKNKEFAALKLNDRNDFFGYSLAANSKVPFESTVLRLSPYDYLLWFDGLNQRNPTVARSPERPVHVRVLFPTTPVPDDTLNRYLQDAVNIAGANWRGFNGKSMPISVYYAKLIADYYGHFQELGLDDIKLEEITPWFL